MLIAFLIAFVFAFSASVGYAQPVTRPPLAAKPAPSNPIQPPPPPPAPLRTDDQVFAQLAKAWTAYYSGRNDDAIKLSDPVTKLADPHFRPAAIEAAHVQARSLWAKGDRRSLSIVAQIWAQLGRTSTLDALLVRLKIVQALNLEATGLPADMPPMGRIAGDRAKLDQGIGILEQVLLDNQPNTTTPEAAIDLARLYVKAKRFDDAEKTLKFVVTLMSDKHTVTQMEIPEALAKPYVDGANAALARLPVERDAGRGPFEAAENLFRAAQSAPEASKAAKYTEALKAYQGVVQDFPDTEFAPRSELAIGHCYVGLQKPALAVEQWKKFVGAMPAGPWRGQALIALVDLYLEEFGDLEDAAKYAQVAQSSLVAQASLPAGQAGKDSSESWAPVAYNVHLRAGLVNFCQNKGEAAADAFEEAKKLTTSRFTADSLDSLIRAARSGKGAIPDDVRAAGGASSQAALALAMGVIYNVAGRPDKAEPFFERVAGPPDSIRTPQSAFRNPLGATPAQIAFAIFGKGAVLQATRKPAEAKEQFLASMKAFPAGTWHDETLYRIAAITQTALADLSAVVPVPRKYKVGVPARPEDLAGPAHADAAEQARLATILKDKDEVLALWQELIRRFPNSLRCEQACYNIGAMEYDMATAAIEAGLNDEKPPQQSAMQMLRDSAAWLARFCDLYPKNLFVGDAYVKQTDVALDWMFDVQPAQALADRGIQWAKSLPFKIEADPGGAPTAETIAAAGKAVKEASAKLPPWAIAAPQPPAVLLDALYNLYLRAAIMAYMRENFDDAIKLTEAAGPARPEEDAHAQFDIQKVGLAGLKLCCQRKELSWDRDAVKAAKTDRQALAFKLAGSYSETTHDERTQVIYERFLAGDPILAPLTTPVEGYCLMELAGAYSNQRINLEKSLRYYKRFYERDLAELPWAADAILRLTVLEHNTSRDARRSIGRLQYILAKYPNDRVAELTLYMLATEAVRAGDKALAEKSCKQYLERFPDGDDGWRAHVQRVLDEEVPKLKDKGKE